MGRLRVSRVGKDPRHRKHMFRTMTTQLLKHERIKTTLPKKCGYRESDKAPMAYIELVDSPKELGKRIEIRKKVYPTTEELRERAPTLDIYNKPILHVSENKKTALLGGIALLLSRARMMPIPTVQDFVAKAVHRPNLNVEFSNIPGVGQPGEKEALAAAEASVEAIKKHANEVHARRKVERQDERARLRAKFGLAKKKKSKKIEGKTDVKKTDVKTAVKKADVKAATKA